MNPQNTSAPGGMQNFDGFGGPNITYESFNAPRPAPAPQPTPQSMNVMNANNMPTGQKMVDAIWKKLAYCALIFSIVFMIGLVVAVVLASIANAERAKLEAEKAALSRNLNGLYEVIGASDQENAIQALDKESEYINGGDILKVDKLLTAKYGDYLLDYADSNINFVRINNMFKVISLGVVQPNGTIRVILYSRIADGDWKLGGFDSTNKKDPCTNSSSEEKMAIKGIVACGEAAAVEEKPKLGEEEEPDEPAVPVEPGEETPGENPDEKKPEEGGETEKEPEKTE
jgi:hypothetical protein